MSRHPVAHRDGPSAFQYDDGACVRRRHVLDQRHAFGREAEVDTVARADQAFALVLQGEARHHDDRIRGFQRREIVAVQRVGPDEVHRDTVANRRPDALQGRHHEGRTNATAAVVANVDCICELTHDGNAREHRSVERQGIRGVLEQDRTLDCRFSCEREMLVACDHAFIDRARLVESGTGVSFGPCAALHHLRPLRAPRRSAPDPEGSGRCWPSAFRDRVR